MTDSLGKRLLEADVEKILRQIQSENSIKQLVSILQEYQSHKQSGEGLKSVPRKPKDTRALEERTIGKLVVVLYAQDSRDASHLVAKW